MYAGMASPTVTRSVKYACTRHHLPMAYPTGTPMRIMKMRAIPVRLIEMRRLATNSLLKKLHSPRSNGVLELEHEDLDRLNWSREVDR